MSELQKWITSISGAVVGQIAVLGFFYLLVANPAASKVSASSGASRPQEVTVMLSRLLDQRAEIPQPEEDVEEPGEEKDSPDKEELPNQDRQFVNTDTTTARDTAPDAARYESNRNTIATTEFQANPDKPRTYGPTLRGEEKIESLSLANQEYVAGEIKPDPTPPPAEVSPPSPAEETPVVDQMQDTAPSETKEKSESEPADELSEGEAREAKPGEADTPPDRISKLLTQPETSKLGDEARMATTAKSFIDPADAASAIKAPSLTGEKDQEAIAEKPAEKFGEPGAPEQKQVIKATPTESGMAADRIKQQQAAAEAIQKQLDESMFNPAFLAQRRKNIQNGTITTIGEGSVDAESTAAGKYKKSVEDAIGQKWHQYRQDRAADVSWGFLRVRFRVSPRGTVLDPRVIKKEATELVTEFSLRAIMDAKIPPMPPDVAAQIGPEGLEMHYNIVIY